MHRKAPGRRVLAAGIGGSVASQGTAVSCLVHRTVVRAEYLGRGRLVLEARLHSLELGSDLGMGLDRAGSHQSVEVHIDLAVDTAVIDGIVAVGRTEVVVVRSLAADVRSWGHRELEHRSQMGQASRTAGCRIDRRGLTL